jgi:hypothetical protein
MWIINGMESILIAFCGVLLGGVLSYTIYSLIGARNPRVKQMREQESFWYNETQNLRKEIKTLKRQVSNGKMGNIPYDAMNATTDDQLIEAIFAVLPSNLKHIINPFKETAKDYVSKNPEIKDAIIQTIKQKAGAAAGKETKIEYL